ncbi:hypothetical protein Mal4_53020 [Maioricimonas rarisocia]|uniref:Uncharacterized protein n=1 Tax=Maioricimonas rarisocia TaxID=2528026 RepID=A0A517ZET8_9PLAN|nr:hypothetical protein [Maioricimonas rarisocia]QDU40939.1 hypothetical protein Mal4_53020 [Maioricimonas rarisocia]
MGRLRRLAAGSVVLGSVLVAPGCAQVSRTGDTTVISHSWVSLLAIFVIGVSMVVFGVGITKESMEAPAPKKGAGKSKAKPRRSTGTYFGVGLTIAGLLILVLGVPSAYVASVTVHPDRVVFRDALFWWANEPRQFDYANLTGVDIEVVEMPIKRRGRKDKEYLVLTGTLSQDRREMNSLLRAAHPVLLNAWRQYREGNANIAAAEPVPGLPASTTHPVQPAPVEVMAEPPGKLTSVESIGRFRPGVSVMVPRNGTYVRAEVLEVFQEQQIRIRYDGDRSNDVAIIPLVDAIPAASSRLPGPGEGPGREITDISEVRPGMTLLGHYEGRWHEVEVIDVSERRITIRWPGERFRQRTPLSWLRIPKE